MNGDDNKILVLHIKRLELTALYVM